MTHKSKGGRDPLDSDSPKFARRQAINSHNGLLGGACFIRRVAWTVLNAKTTSDEAKVIAVRIEQDAELLINALKERNPLWELQSKKDCQL